MPLTQQFRTDLINVSSRNQVVIPEVVVGNPGSAPGRDPRQSHSGMTAFVLGKGFMRPVLVDIGIVRAIPARRGRLYCYDAYLDILSEGTEPIR